MELEERANQNNQAEVGQKEERANQNSNEEVEQSENKKATSLIDNIKDPVYRSKLLRWMCLPVACISMGIVDSLSGTTILDIQIITSVNKDQASYYFTAVNIGYLLGSFLGGVLFGKINSYFLMLVTGCLGAVACIGTPYCSTFATMFIIRCALGLFQGVLICILTSEHMQIWGTKGESHLQLINGVYAVGGMVGPLLTEPFLADKETDEKMSQQNLSLVKEPTNSTFYFWNNITEPTSSALYFWNNLTEPTNSTSYFWNNLTEPTNSTSYFWNNLTEPTNSTSYFWNNLTEPTNSTSYFWNNLTEPTNSTSYFWNNLTQPTNSTLHRTTNVHYAFLIAGSIFIVTTIPTFLALIIPNSVLQTKEKVAHENVDRKLPLPLKMFMIVLLFLYFFTYCCVEVTFSSYLMTFVVDQYEEVTSHQGAFITTFFWASFAACRLFSMFTSKYLIAVRQLYVHLSLLVFAFSGFLVSALYSRIDILTVFTCMVGLSCSAIFSAMISWTEAELMKVTGPISAVTLVGSSTGASVVPVVVGHLMEHSSNLWFIYCLMMAMGLAISFFLFLLFFNRYYVDKRYGKLSEAINQEKQYNAEVSSTDLA